MRVLIVNNWYYPNMIGGAEQSVNLLAQELTSLGHEVAILTGDGKSKFVDVDVYNSIKIFRVKTHITKEKHCFMEKIFSKFLDICNPTLREKVKFVVREFKPEIVHTNALTGLSFYLWKVLDRCKIPVVNTIRDYSVYSPKGLFEKKGEVNFIYWLFLKFYGFFNKKNSKMVDFCTAPSLKILNSLYDLGFFKSVPRKAIPNAVEVCRKDVELNIKKRLERNRELKYVLFAGRLFHFKGVNLILDAFQRLEDQGYRLVVCGSGDLEDEVVLRSRIDPRIIFKGMLSSQELEKEYMNADLVVFPSLCEEAFGRIIIEANKFGAPVITTGRGAIPEVMKNIGGGEILAKETPEELAMCIKSFFEGNKAKYYDNILKNIDKYDVTNQAKEFELVYKDVMSGINK